MFFYKYPPQKMLKDIKYVFFFIFTWDSYKNYLVAKKYCGLKELDHTSQGTFTNLRKMINHYIYSLLFNVFKIWFL